jgi:hypothetical protein
VDQKAVDELVKNAVKDVLNKDEFKSLHSASGYILYVNPGRRHVFSSSSH